MRTVIILAIAVLLMHATWRVGVTYKTHYEFQDELEQLVRFAADKSVQEVENRALGCCHFTRNACRDTATTLKAEVEAGRTVRGEVRRPTLVARNE